MLRFFLGGQQSNEPSKKNPVHLRTQIGLLHVKYLFSFQIVCSYSPTIPLNYQTLFSQCQGPELSSSVKTCENPEAQPSAPVTQAKEVPKANVKCKVQHQSEKLNP